MNKSWTMTGRFSLTAVSIIINWIKMSWDKTVLLPSKTMQAIPIWIINLRQRHKKPTTPRSVPPVNLRPVPLNTKLRWRSTKPGVTAMPVRLWATPTLASWALVIFTPVKSTRPGCLTAATKLIWIIKPVFGAFLSSTAWNMKNGVLF